MTKYTYVVTCKAPGERAVFEDKNGFHELRFEQECSNLSNRYNAAYWHTVTLSRRQTDDPKAVEELRRWGGDRD